jgi:hypothetical protein
MKTILTALLFLLLAGGMFAQTVQHPLKIKVNVNNDDENQKIKAPFLVALGHNPHYTIVDDDFDVVVTFTCAAINAQKQQFTCADYNTYYDDWSITWNFAIRLLIGGDEYIARSMLAGLIEDTTPESLQKARVETKKIADFIRSKSH